MKFVLRRLTLTGLCVLSSSVTLLGQERSAADVLKEIQKQEDAAPAALFDELGLMRDYEAYRALEQAVEAVRSSKARDAAYAAFIHFAGVEDLERRAIGYLVRQTGPGRKVDQRAAARALARFGPAAHEACRELLLQHRDEVVRARTLKPLLAAMMAGGRPHDLELVLDEFRVPHSGSRARLIEVLGAFDSKPALAVLAECVIDTDRPLRSRVAIVEAVAPCTAAGADDVLGRAVRSGEPTLEYYALKAITGRGSSRHLKQIRRLTRSKAPEVRRQALIALTGILGHDPDWRQQVAEHARSKDTAMRQAAAVSLGVLRTAESLELLHELLLDREPSVRLEALLQVSVVRVPESIPLLIERIDSERGRLRRDVLEVLRLLTGEDHGASRERWRAWWRDHAQGFVMPDLALARERDVQRAARRKRGSTQVSFYGLQVYSERVCFVLDVSGSMRGARIAKAKSQLRGALEKYPDGHLFNILFFSGSVYAWQDRLVAMTAKVRSAGLEFVDGQLAGGGTAIYDALAEAFDDPRIDTLYLLSDGEPSAGAITEPSEIRSEVARWNAVRKVQIHCIALGRDNALLRGLAADSGGEYRRVK